MQDPALMPSKAAQREADVVLDIIKSVADSVDSGEPADRALARLYKEHKEYGARDRRFFSAAVFSHFRWLAWTRLHDLAPREACVLSFLLDAAILHPAIQNLAESSRLGTSNLRPMGFQPVTEKAAAAAEWLGLAEPMPLDVLVPPWVLPALHNPDGAGLEAHVENCIASFQVRPPTWLRAPRIREAVLGERLLQHGDRFKQHPALPAAVATDESFNIDALRTEIGIHFEIQDLASQCVGLVCAPASGQHWWDVCAGAGGKAIHLADLMDNCGKVLASDTRQRSLDELVRRGQLARARFINVDLRDATDGPPVEGIYDGVLVDAPCSGLGTWSRNPDARWRTPESDVVEKARVQLMLLRQAARGVRPGGALVYSVCTMTQAETVDVARKFLAEAPAFAPAPAPHPLTGAETDGMVWVWPWDGPCDGMFIARMRRAS